MQHSARKFSWNFNIKKWPIILYQCDLLNLCDFPAGLHLTPILLRVWIEGGWLVCRALSTYVESWEEGMSYQVQIAQRSSRVQTRFKYRNKFLGWHFVSLYRHQDHIQHTLSHGNLRKLVMSPAWRTNHSWIFWALPLFFQTMHACFFFGSEKWILSLLLINRFSKTFSSSYCVRKLSAAPMWFFDVLLWVVEESITYKLFTSRAVIIYKLLLPYRLFVKIVLPSFVVCQ